MARNPSAYPNAHPNNGFSRVSSVQGNRKASLNGNSFSSSGYSITPHKTAISRVSSVQGNRKASLDGNSFASRYSPSSRSAIQWNGKEQGGARVGGMVPYVSRLMASDSQEKKC